MADITAITPTVETRCHLFAELATSMARQTVQPTQWLIGWDTDREGPAAVRNRLIGQAVTEWVFPIDDDDILLPWHFEELGRHLDDGADVVWTLPDTPGCALGAEALYPPFDPAVLADHNIIAASAAIRRSVFLEAGGYRDEECEDWRLWQRLLESGARFRQVPLVSWVYRSRGEWPHRSEFGKGI